jgi:DNA-binding NarL/FixJ family response regulator
MVRIIIADDQLLFRTMLAEMLKKDAEIEIAAECGNGEETLAACFKLMPDMVLLDIGMPNKGGIEVLRELKAVLPDVRVVMLTTFEDDENIKTAVLLGADGYLIKELTPDALIMAIKSIHNDMILFHRGAYHVLQSALEAQQNLREQKLAIGDMVFDAVDISIIKLIVQGKSNREIAALLHYSEGTIKNRVSKILSVTGFSHRSEISVFAVNNQIV